MSGWGEGYVTESSYTPSYQKEMAPAHLRLLLLLRQQKAPDFTRPFRYLDLGCGMGVTTTVLAAANPCGQFVGVDFSPDHVLQARDLAEAAGVGNVRFIEASFADLLEMPDRLGEFDVLACHGVYTWVTGENQRRIVEIMRRHVRPGGLVYIGYNAMPGWAQLDPIRHLVARLAESRSAARAETALDDAHEILGALREQQAGYAAGNAALDRWLERFPKEIRSYLAHEYLPESAAAIWHDRLARDLSAARLRYIGSARLVENIDSINIPEPLRQRMAAADEQGFGQTLRDLIVNQTFRLDVFARGALRADPEQADAAFRSLPVALTGPPPERVTIRAAHGEIPLSETVARPVLDVLAAGPATIAEVVEKAEARGIVARQARQAVTALLAGQLALPLAALSPLDEATDACRRFNRIARERALRGATLPCLASPILGGGLPMPGLEQRLLDPAARAAARDEPRNTRPERIEALEARIPFLERLGIAGPESRPAANA